jgi:hypothetical protein
LKPVAAEVLLEDGGIGAVHGAIAFKVTVARVSANAAPMQQVSSVISLEG